MTAPKPCLPVNWTCTCGTTGTYTEAYKTDSANPDARHLADCPGTVVTTTHAGLAARLGGAR